MQTTSWQNVSKWYHQKLGREGDYFHQAVILPKVLSILQLKKDDQLLDLACGQGILSRAISSEIEYLGLDLSQDLIHVAKQLNKSKLHQFLIADVTKTLPIKKVDFTHSAIILALQNIEDAEAVIRNAHKHLLTNGHLLIVLNHPCFRIPRQSSWGIDQNTKMQYRRINRYLSPLSIPINMEPGKQDQGKITWTFHQPLSFYTQILYQAGFVIELIEEWTSPKKSVGKFAKMENRSRQEFPMFLAIKALKI